MKQLLIILFTVFSVQAWGQNAVGRNNYYVTPTAAEEPSYREAVMYLFENNNNDEVGDNDFSGSFYLYDATTYYEGSYSARNNGTVSAYVPDIITETGITVCAWVYATSSVENDQRVFENDPSSGDGLYLRLGMLGNGDVYVYANTTQIWAAANEVSLSTWTHLAVTYNKTTGAATVYKNGNVIGSQVTTASANLDGYWYMMADPVASHDLMGYLDDFRIFEEILSEANIEWVMNNPGDTLPE